MNFQEIIVQLSNIKSVSYDDDLKTLHMKFKSGGHYAYYDVPEHTFNALLDSQSKGHFFAKEIRPRYNYAKLH